MAFVIMAIMAFAWGYAMACAIDNSPLAILASGLGGYAIASAFQQFGFV